MLLWTDQKKSIFDILKIAIGIGCVVVGAAIIHASLDIVTFGRIRGHLL
jgi:hypothetical protein